MPVLRPLSPDGRRGRPRLILSRRQVGVGAASVVGTWLAGCSVDRDDAADQSESPTADEREAIPSTPREDPTDLAVLAATLASTRDLRQTALASAAQSRSGDALAEVSRILGIHVAVLARLVRAGSLPGDTADGDVPRAAPADASEQTTSPAGAEDLAESLSVASSADVLGDELISVTAANLPTLMSLHGVRRACVEVLTDSVDRPRLSGPDGAGAITALAGLRQCIYGLEVLAARGAGQDKDAYLQAIGSLRGPTRQLTELAGPAAPAAPLGYRISAPLSTVRERRALATQLMVAAAKAIIAGSGARAGDADAIEGTVQLIGLVSRVGTSIGVPLTGFPGLSVPTADS
ncbi:MAG: hypothetical protein WBG57_11110 [Ornithinimicrobium sp.]